MIMEDKMVELTRFTLVSEAEVLANLLKSEGVDCYVRDCFINQIYSGVDFGGVKVELLEKDLPQAKEIMKAYGYLPSEGEGGELKIENGELRIGESVEVEENGEAGEMGENPEKIRAEYEKNKTNLARTMTIFSVIVLLLVSILILLNKYYYN